MPMSELFNDINASLTGLYLLTYFINYLYE